MRETARGGEFEQTSAPGVEVGGLRTPGASFPAAAGNIVRIVITIFFIVFFSCS